MGNRARRAAALTTVLCFGLVGATPSLLRDAAQAQANVIGQWTTLPYTMPINPIHVGLLRTGKVVIVAGSENDPNKHTESSSKAAVWDLQAGTIAVQDLLWDVFCNGMAFLPDGRALIIGGTEQYDPFHGEARATVFDPATEKFVQVQSMAHGRWYATATAMNDGRILAFSGLDESGATNKAIELYRIAFGWSPELVAPWTPPLYPWLHLLPNGNVFYSGSGAASHVYNPSTSTWTLNVATTRYGQSRSYGTSVLLPLVPQNGYVSRVMIMGGHNPATATAEIIDLSQATPQWRLVPPMSLPRIQMSAVLLPNGKVLASGGSLNDEDGATASRAADLFDPVSETWSPAGVATYARLYHSVALLLPDASVVTAGSNPARGTYEDHIEIWKPPYLFTTDGSGNVVPASRPTISAAPARVAYAGPFQVQSPNATDIGSVVLMRAGSPTHAFDMEQRMVGLSFSTAGTTLTVSGPPDARIAPPGYYMLFLLNRQGVPSIAPFVQVSATAGNLPPTGTITEPAGNVTIQAGQSVNFAGSGSDADGAVATFSWLFPDGAPDSSMAQNPGPVTFRTPGTYVASVTTVDTLGENDPSPPTRTVTVTAANQPPTASAGGPYSGTTGQSIQFNGSGSSDPDGTVTGYSWTFGDGSIGSGVSPTHAYASPGGYTVALTVTDNSGASSSASTTANVSAPVIPPAAPGNLTATLSKSKVLLAWADGSGNEDGFKIERSTDGQTFTQIATVGANATTYTNTGVNSNKNASYYYRVRAYSSGGNSGYSNTAVVQIR